METANTRLIQQFKALAEPVRLRLLSLCASSECAVSELTDIVGLSQPRVSQHLKVLCEAGLLNRFRDGHFVYYRVPGRGRDAVVYRQLSALIDDDPVFRADGEALAKLRADHASDELVPGEDRDFYRHLVELTVTAPIGDVLDIGSGRGDLLRLLASRANRIVGVDIDSDARRHARAKLMTAGILNCSLRHGDMYRLPWTAPEFDTVILDDVLFDAARPVDVLSEARRVLKPGGRLFIVSRVDSGTPASSVVADWCAESGLRLAVPKLIPASEPRWLVAVATQVEHNDVAA